MTREEEIRARLEKATPWPWFSENVNGVLSRTDDTYTALAICRDDHNEENNAKFIANAPADLDYLLKENQRLRGALEQIKSVFDDSEISDMDYAIESYKIARQALEGTE